MKKHLKILSLAVTVTLFTLPQLYCLHNSVYSEIRVASCALAPSMQARNTQNMKTMLLAEAEKEFKSATRDWDMQYLQGKIDYYGLLAREESFLSDLVIQGSIKAMENYPDMQTERFVKAVLRTTADTNDTALRPIAMVAEKCAGKHDSGLCLDVLLKSIADEGYQIDPYAPENAIALQKHLKDIGRHKPIPTLSEIRMSQSDEQLEYYKTAVAEGLPDEYISRELLGADDTSGLRSLEIKATDSNGRPAGRFNFNIDARGLNMAGDIRIIVSQSILPHSTIVLADLFTEAEPRHLQDVEIQYDQRSHETAMHCICADGQIHKIRHPLHARMIRTLQDDYGYTGPLFNITETQNPDIFDRGQLWGDFFPYMSIEGAEKILSIPDIIWTLNREHTRELWNAFQRFLINFEDAAADFSDVKRIVAKMDGIAQKLWKKGFWTQEEYTQYLHSSTRLDDIDKTAIVLTQVCQKLNLPTDTKISILLENAKKLILNNHRFYLNAKQLEQLHSLPQDIKKRYSLRGMVNLLHDARKILTPVTDIQDWILRTAA